MTVLMIGAQKQLADSSGRIILVSNNDRLRNVFTVSGLSRVFTIYESEAEALLALEANVQRMTEPLTELERD